MPYIAPNLRADIDGGDTPATAGELNYKLTKVCLDYEALAGIRYATYNDIIGALEACKLEFYRRLVAPYEDSKIEANGDVYFAPVDLEIPF